MIAFIIRRLLISIPVLFGVTLLTFLIVNARGNPVADMALNPRYRAEDVARMRANMGLDVDACLREVEHSPYFTLYQSLLFSRIVPCVKDIGLWGDKVRRAYADMGVLDMAGVDLGALMKQDEDIAEALDAEKRELEARRHQVEATIALGETG